MKTQLLHLGNNKLNKSKSLSVELLIIIANRQIQYNAEILIVVLSIKSLRVQQISIGDKIQGVVH